MGYLGTATINLSLQGAVITSEEHQDLVRIDLLQGLNQGTITLGFYEVLLDIDGNYTYLPEMAASWTTTPALNRNNLVAFLTGVNP